ncbi:MAG TPA: deoxyribose-phosphate aldolase [Planctomycetota bacterium]|nr:deoxyribose-phosphate aldolase [Planctomycetota bacterium]
MEPNPWTPKTLARHIDHTVLAPGATDEDLANGCDLARQFGTAAIFVKPHYVITACRKMAGTGVKVGTVAGFPHGLSITRIKADEAQAAIDMGAAEIDMVVNIGKVLSNDWSYVTDDIAAVAEVVKTRGMMIKVIFENSYLADVQKVKLCQICEQVGVDFAKTSTGFGAGGAIPADVALMVRNLRSVKVKAAGGIRRLADAIQMLEIGAARIGTSATAEIMMEAQGVLKL